MRMSFMTNQIIRRNKIYRNSILHDENKQTNKNIKKLTIVCL